MGKLTYGRPLAARHLSSPFSAEERNYSEHTAEKINEDARRIVYESYVLVNQSLSCDLINAKQQGSNLSQSR